MPAAQRVSARRGRSLFVWRRQSNAAQPQAGLEGVDLDAEAQHTHLDTRGWGDQQPEQPDLICLKPAAWRAPDEGVLGVFADGGGGRSGPIASFEQPVWAVKLVLVGPGQVR